MWGTGCYGHNLVRTSRLIAELESEVTIFNWFPMVEGALADLSLGTEGDECKGLGSKNRRSDWAYTTFAPSKMHCDRFFRILLVRPSDRRVCVESARVIPPHAILNGHPGQSERIRCCDATGEHQLNRILYRDACFEQIVLSDEGEVARGRVRSRRDVDDGQGFFRGGLVMNPIATIPSLGHSRNTTRLKLNCEVTTVVACRVTRTMLRTTGIHPMTLVAERMRRRPAVNETVSPTM